MKIAAASLAFSAQHSVTNSFELRESLRAWSGTPRPDAQASAISHAVPPSLPSISSDAYNAQAQGQSGAEAINEAIDRANHDPILQMIRSMLELLTGHVVRTFSIAERQTRTAQLAVADPRPASPQAAAPQGAATGNAGLGIEYQRHEVRSETEQSAFQAAGTIRTADGKEISFQLDLTMRRSFRQEVNLSLTAGDARQKDPLVINFGGTAAQLQSRRFLFDITGNGEREQVPLLGSGSGFLALDLNGNGRIDSGKELFGTASGNGFADLAAHDGDGNGWIDENDPVFGKLRVWAPDGEGAGTLASLQQKNVGALFLGSRATPFELRDGNNQSLGSVRASGIHLSEDGVAGTLQQIDLSV